MGQASFGYGDTHDFIDLIEQSIVTESEIKSALHFIDEISYENKLRVIEDIEHAISVLNKAIENPYETKEGLEVVVDPDIFTVIFAFSTISNTYRTIQAAYFLKTDKLDGKRAQKLIHKTGIIQKLYEKMATSIDRTTKEGMRDALKRKGISTAILATTFSYLTYSSTQKEREVVRKIRINEEDLEELGYMLDEYKYVLMSFRSIVEKQRELEEF